MPSAAVDHGGGGTAIWAQVGRAAPAAGMGRAGPSVLHRVRSLYPGDPAGPPGGGCRDVSVARVPDGEPPWPTGAGNPALVVARTPGWRDRCICAGRDGWKQRAPPAALDSGCRGDWGTRARVKSLWLVCHSVSRLPWLGRFADCERRLGLAIVCQVWLPPIARRRVNHDEPGRGGALNGLPYRRRFEEGFLCVSSCWPPWPC